MATKSRQKSPKIASIFSCDTCNYRCRKESDYKKHLLTRKHLKETNGNIGNIKETKKVAIHQCSDCMRSFASRAGLWKHKQKCCGSDIDVDNNLDDLVATYTKDKEVEFKELILLLLKENKEIQKNFMDMIPHIKGHAEHSFNTTTTNSHNTNNFNIQMFLDEHCKNAMNLTDFINSLPITNETYDHTIENGLTKTITHMITNGLNNMDVLRRPIHCTDTKRKTMYVKDNDVWEKDNQLNILLDGIKVLSSKQRINLSKWQDANAGWDRDENLQTKLTRLVFNSMTSIEEDEKETNKIIKAIGINTYLSNDIKDEYK